MRFVVTTCSIQLILDRERKSRTNLSQLSQRNEVAVHVGPTSCCCK